MHFEQDVKPLFRAYDRDVRRFAFDLRSMTTYPRTPTGSSAGSMPCDRAWHAERVAALRQLTDAGKPA